MLLRNDEEWEKRIATRLAAVSPAGSVGASASQRCPPDTRTAMTERRFSVHSTVFAATKRRVILNAKRERIRNTLKKNGLPQPFTRFRNDRTIAYCTHLTAFVATKRFVILNAKRERIRIPLKRERIATAAYAASQ